MKKTFLKSFVVAAVTTAAVALSSVAAFAATDLWKFDSEKGVNQEVPAVYGMVASDYTQTVTCENNKNIGFADTDFGDCAGKTGLDLYKQALTGQNKSVYLEPTKTGTIYAYVVRTGNNNGTVRFYNATVSGTTYTRGTQIGNDITVAGRKTADASAASNVDAEPVALKVEKGKGYMFYSNSTNVILYGLKFEALTGTAYDEKSFTDATDNSDTTPVIDSVKSSLTFDDVESKVVNLNYDETGVHTLTDGNYANADETITLVSPSSRTAKLFKSADGSTKVIRSAGGTNASGRYVAVKASAGDVVVVKGAKSSNGTDARTLFITTDTPSNSVSNAIKDYTVIASQDCAFPITAEGTYNICFAASIDFESVELCTGKGVAAPTVTLSQIASADGYAQFKGVISGSASEDSVVSAINVVYAKGYDVAGDITYPAKSIAVTSVAKEGSDYAFLVVVNKAKADANGLKLQAKVDFETTGITYTNASEVVEYNKAM